LYEDNLSFPTSDRLVQSRNLKTDESFTTNAWCHTLKRMWVTVPICINLLFSCILTWFCLMNLHLMKKIHSAKPWLTSNCKCATVVHELLCLLFFILPIVSLKRACFLQDFCCFFV
jgi:hypothetical protein